MSQGTSDALDRLTRPVAPSARGVLISVNPRAGARSSLDRVQAVVDALVAAGYHVEVTTDLGQLSDKAQGWHERGDLRVVVAAGGDGTASAVRNALAADMALLPLPLGTECLLARHVLQSADPADVRATIECGHTVGLDLGRAGSRLFLLMMSVGIDAEVVHRMQAARTGHITRAAYFRPALTSIRQYQYPALRVTCEDSNGESDPLCCRWLLGFNLPCYARGLPFAPHADSADGLLDVCTFERGSLWHALRYYWHVARGVHANLPDVRQFRSGKFRVEADDGSPVAVQVDGDRAGTLPLDVEISRGALTMMVSAAGAERLGFTTTHD